jgi:trk system potassium uptake protein
LPNVSDPWVCLPIAVGIIAGGLGFPVLIELRREIRPRAWSLHTKLTLTMTGALLVLGPAAVTAIRVDESANVGTSRHSRKAAGGLLPGRGAANGRLRDTGLRSDGRDHLVGHRRDDVHRWRQREYRRRHQGHDFVVLLFVIIAEVRGHAEAEVFGRTVAPAVVRQAMTVALLGVAVVAAGTALLLAITGLDLDRVLFEAISAFSTTGLSTGITTQLSGSAQLVLVVLMFLGRVGTVTLASALALRSRQRLYRMPEGRPIVG